MYWGKFELNSVGHWPSRSRFRQPWSSWYTGIYHLFTNKILVDLVDKENMLLKRPGWWGHQNTCVPFWWPTFKMQLCQAFQKWEYITSTILTCFRSYLASMRRDDTKISWDSVSTFDLHKITSNYLLCIDTTFFSITHNQGLLQNQNVLELSFCVRDTVFFFYIRTWGTRFLKDSMILELLASW